MVIEELVGWLCLCIFYLNTLSVNRCRLQLLFQHRKCSSDSSPSHKLSWGYTSCSTRGCSVTQQGEMWVRLLKGVPGSLKGPFSCHICLMVMGVVVVWVLSLKPKVNQFEWYPPSHEHAFDPIDDLYAGCWWEVGYFKVSWVVVCHHKVVLLFQFAEVCSNVPPWALWKGYGD